MATKRRKKRKPQNNLLVLKLLILVVIVLVVFEGKLVITMFSSGSGTETASKSEQVTASNEASDHSDKTDAAAPSPAPAPSGSTDVSPIGVGLGSIGTGSAHKTEASEQPASDTYAEHLDSFAVVKETSPAVDDSYFSDAVFIGDSRMEGFRNTSGITQGEFLTSVGMSLAAIADQKVNTSEGSITVYQGLSGRQYGKIYLMLGANDLGYYPWEEFLPHAERVFDQFHQLQPNATIYVCSCIYVEENKISTSYVTNENVIKVNDYLLQACEDLDYCYYLNLNEKFSDGYRELIPGASQDGVHLFPEYTKVMLDYLKSHYIYIEPEPVAEEEAETDAA